MENIKSHTAENNLTKVAELVQSYTAKCVICL